MKVPLPLHCSGWTGRRNEALSTERFQGVRKLSEATLEIGPEVKLEFLGRDHYTVAAVFPGDVAPNSPKRNSTSECLHAASKPAAEKGF